VAEIIRSQLITELLAKVGSKLDIDITDTSTPSDAQVVSWLNDAALLIARFLPEDRLGLLQDKVEVEDVGESLVVDSPFERFVSIVKYGVVCKRLTQRDMDLISTRSPLLHTTRNPAFCVSGNAGYINLRFWPTSIGPVTVKAIRKPEAYAVTDWTPGTYSLPVELELLAVDYAVVQGKIQDEEVQQAQFLLQAWMQQAGFEAQIEGLGVQA
jgi:hypothetical protein